MMASRVARLDRQGRWHMLIEGEAVCQLAPLDWSQDTAGHWPRVDLLAEGLGADITCPQCETGWTLEEMDCVFGTARADGNDLLVLVRCASCRLPHRIRVPGFMTAYPRVVDLMRGWADAEKRRQRFARAERHLYGAESIEP